MKKGPVYYPEDVLVEKHQNGEYNWVDYISHYSEEWCEEYETYCKLNNLEEDNDTNAEAFVAHKTEQLENALTDEA